VTNARTLLLRGLGELLWVERLLVFEALPELVEAAHDDELRAALAAHLEQTRTHAERVEAAFRAAGADPASARSDLFAAARDEASTRLADAGEPLLRDVCVASAAATAEHVELALYVQLVPLARSLGLDGAVAGLEESRREEEQALARAEEALAAAAARLPARQ
jgi:ferritin-like metal-binding protein YciE